MSTITNAGGIALGNRIFGSGNNIYKVGRTIMNRTMQTVPYGFYHFRKKDEDE
jgi:hypothetical protein